jgi:hypothetical protein
MKKTIIITALVSLGLIALYKTSILESLVAFLLVGAIPGTNYSVSSNTMLIAITCVVLALIFQVATIKTFYVLSKVRTKKLVLARKKRMPKRRFSQI